MSNNHFQYSLLKEPIPITEQQWPEDTVPLVCTRTMSYNHEPYIRDCIEGILMQKTTFPVRVCIHDDASTDATAAVIHEYQERYPRLIWAYYRKENIYKHPERKKLLEEFMGWASTGKYLALCEGDDYWTDPLKLQKQYEALESHPESSFCVHNAIIKHANKQNEQFVVNARKGSQYFGPEEILSVVGQFAPTASYFFKQTNYEILPEWRHQAPYGDFILEMYAMKAGMGYHINESMSVYRMGHEGSWTNSTLKSPDYNKTTNFMNQALVTLKMMEQDFPEIDTVFFNYKRAHISFFLAIEHLIHEKKIEFKKEIERWAYYNTGKTRKKMIIYHCRHLPSILRLFVLRYRNKLKLL